MGRTNPVRFVLALAGILVSVPPLFFFWIGSQRFIRRLKRALAIAVTLETGVLLLLSLALLFTPAVARSQAILLISTVATIAVILLAYRLLR
jgi:hypothetical protein